MVSGLTSGPWMGPASVSMACAAAPYVSWLRAVAAQAEETGAQAKSAAAAYQAAFVATVPPAMVAENRSLFATLVATNLFGRNSQAIAANEAQYSQMWAQDAAAMYGYAASSATATQLPTFVPPPHNTNPIGAAGQSAAVDLGAASAAGNVQSTIQQAFTAVPSALQGAAAAPVAAVDPLTTISNLIAVFADLPAAIATFTADIPLGSLALVALPFGMVGALNGSHTDRIVSGWNGEQAWPGEGPAPVKPFPAPLLNLPKGTVPTRLSAGLADAHHIGGLSVPPSWTIATPAVKPSAVTLSVLPAIGAAESISGASGTTLSQMALAGMAGRATAGCVGIGGVMARPRDSLDVFERKTIDDATKTTPRKVVTGVAAELREFTKLRDEGILTDEEYSEQKNRLLGR